MLELCFINWDLIVEADGMNDKASATRSKHSVTEQRRRSKINERFFSLLLLFLFIGKAVSLHIVFCAYVLLLNAVEYDLVELS